jgi:hypothetical protein
LGFFRAIKPGNVQNSKAAMNATRRYSATGP